MPRAELSGDLSGDGVSSLGQFEGLGLVRMCWCVLSCRNSHPEVWLGQWRREQGQLKLTWS